MCTFPTSKGSLEERKENVRVCYLDVQDGSFIKAEKEILMNKEKGRKGKE